MTKNIKIFKDADTADSVMDELKTLSLEDQKKIAFRLLDNMDDEQKAGTLKLIRLQSVLVSANILDDYCGIATMYHDDAKSFLQEHMPDTEFARTLDAIDTFADKDVYTQKLMELDVNTAMYMADRVSKKDIENGYDPIQFTMLQFAYAHWIEERNDYLDFFLTAFEDEVDKLAIKDIVKNNDEHISEKIAMYIDGRFEDIKFSDSMGVPEGF